MLLGVVLFATAFLIFAQPRLPPYARIDAIEERFASQIERLREIALTDTGMFTATPATQDRDRELLAVPGILEASTEFSRGGWRTYASEFNSSGTWSPGFRSKPKPAPNRPVLNKIDFWPRGGAKIEILEYAGVVVRGDGSLREYRILLDLGELRSLWEAEGGEEEN
jgi:hypothetical protein